MIRIDIPRREIDSGVSEKEIETRKKQWQPPAPKARKGFLAMMEKIVQPAEVEAMLKP